MSNPTPAQEEFARIVNGADETSLPHPEDRHEEAYRDDPTEEDEYRNTQISAAMRMPTLDGGRPSRGPGGQELKLPPASFDSGRSTGVKGVIADARSYEAARRSRFKDAVQTARRSVFGAGEAARLRGSSDSDTEGDEASGGEEAFLRQWRESRKRELESEAKAGVRNRRTSPSVRLFGRFDEVDALGYLDAIEKVGRDTVVVVFVHDRECEVSTEIECALIPLVSRHPAVHFVKVHYDDIEFDNAAVPAVLAYRNQGDLFANLTGIIELIPEESDFDSDALATLFRKHSII